MGILQPIVVRKAGAGYELIAGERRLRAAKLAGLATIPVVVRDTDDADTLREALIENIHREDLGPIELAEAFRQLLEELGLKQEELADRVGVSRSHIANTIRLLQLPIDVQQLLTDGKLQAGHARALLALGDAEAQNTLALRTVAEDLSVRDVEELVRRYVEAPAEKPAKAATGGTPPADTTHVRGRGDPVGAARDPGPDPDGEEARPGRDRVRVGRRPRAHRVRDHRVRARVSPPTDRVPCWLAAHAPFAAACLCSLVIALVVAAGVAVGRIARAPARCRTTTARRAARRLPDGPGARGGVAPGTCGGRRPAVPARGARERSGRGHAGRPPTRGSVTAWRRTTRAGFRAAFPRDPAGKRRLAVPDPIAAWLDARFGPDRAVPERAAQAARGRGAGRTRARAVSIHRLVRAIWWIQVVLPRCACEPDRMLDLLVVRRDRPVSGLRVRLIAPGTSLTSD